MGQGLKVPLTPPKRAENPVWRKEESKSQREGPPLHPEDFSRAGSAPSQLFQEVKELINAPVLRSRVFFLLFMILLRAIRD